MSFGNTETLVLTLPITAVKTLNMFWGLPLDVEAAVRKNIANLATPPTIVSNAVLALKP